MLSNNVREGVMDENGTMGTTIDQQGAIWFVTHGSVLNGLGRLTHCIAIMS
jgi:hypothetical protein